MDHSRRILAVALVTCLFWADSLRAATSFTPSSIRQQVEQFGVGAKVGLKLAGGEKLRGSIEAIDDDGFLLGARRIAYDQVAQMQLASRIYRASKGGPEDARRVALALGVGKHVVVKMTGNRELHGHIQALDSDHFTLMPDRQAAPVQIAYNDVQHLEKNLSFGATIVLVVLIVAAVVVAASVAATR